MLPVCDHYSGVEVRMRKSLALQAQMLQEFGTCVFDVTLDCEDGAAIGAEIEQAHLVASLANETLRTWQAQGHHMAQRVAARLHPVHHKAFEAEVDIIVGTAAAALSHVMLPKIESVAEVTHAVSCIDAATNRTQRHSDLPLHVLIESALAVHNVFEIAAHPRVQSVSFGLLDFVSSHGGAIPASAMGLRAQDDTHTLDQFHQPLVVRAKLAIASACHAHGKVPSHCVVTQWQDPQALGDAAQYASNALGYQRMWSIHPAQIRPILKSFMPAQDLLETAAHIVTEAARQAWAPIAVNGILHDRASYRYFWQVLERAQQTGCTLPHCVSEYFAPQPI